MQIPAIQRHGISVDKNLYGVSGEVTAPGVLAFRRVFAALRAGKAPCRNAPQKEFAREDVRDAGQRAAAACPQHNEARRWPMRPPPGNEQTRGA